MYQIAVLDDYQNIALTMADWSLLAPYGDVHIFNAHNNSESSLATQLHPYDILCIMRERTPMTRSLLMQLPNLKLIVSTGPKNAAIDLSATVDFGITVLHTGYP